jgi:hypothetical protein
MNWLETLFGLSPDGGNGTTEMVIALGILLALAAAVATRARARTRRAKPTAT